VLLSALWPGAGIDLQSFIWRSLRTQDDVLKVYQQGPYEGSVYFLAVPKYSAFGTCDTWGAEALRAADFHVHAGGSFLPGNCGSKRPG
jgi:hypothetical protein